ncbi:hypothetical protein LZ30DRAFT_23465 [Colletotrichum cereale]|nr:hypothetical protein LZ30DRAFT_23465 [Colletotrichum cereale]
MARPVSPRVWAMKIPLISSTALQTGSMKDKARQSVKRVCRAFDARACSRRLGRWVPQRPGNHVDALCDGFLLAPPWPFWARGRRGQGQSGQGGEGDRHCTAPGIETGSPQPQSPWPSDGRPEGLGGGGDEAVGNSNRVIGIRGSILRGLGRKLAFENGYAGILYGGHRLRVSF